MVSKNKYGVKIFFGVENPERRSIDLFSSDKSITEFLEAKAENVRPTSVVSKCLESVLPKLSIEIIVIGDCGSELWGYRRSLPMSM